MKTKALMKTEAFSQNVKLMEGIYVRMPSIEQFIF